MLTDKMATSSASSPPELGKKRHATLTDQDMEDILKKRSRNAANTDKVIGNSVNIIRKYLNENNLPVDFESLDDKALDELLSKLYCEVRTSDGKLYKNPA